MPYPNEHAARVRDPDSFVPDSFRSKDLKNGIRIIIGKLKGGTSMVVQAYRFSVDKFTVEQVKRWLEDNKINYIKFEPATLDTIEHSGILGMKWGVRRASSSAGQSSDHKAYAEIRKKGLRNMSDDEIKLVVERASLVSTYKRAGLIKQHNPNQLSNQQLRSGINKQKLRVAIIKNPISMKFKHFMEVGKMDDSKVESLMKRINLEKSYKDAVHGGTIAAGKYLNEFLKKNP